MMDKCFETIHTRILSTLEAWKEFKIYIYKKKEEFKTFYMEGK